MVCRELARILTGFERAQVKAIPYKGPTLAQLVYGDLGLRSFSDLDFLVGPVDLERARQTLVDLGYRVSGKLDPSVEHFLLRTGNECAFDSAAGSNLVELQWALFPSFYNVDLHIEDLMQRSSRISFEGREILSLSPEDSLLALSLHAAKHLWMRLIWLADIAETLRSQTIDYSLVSSRARSLGVARILNISLWLVKNTLGGELPEGAEKLLAADPSAPALGAEFSQRLEREIGYDFESTRYFRLILKLRERPIDRWRTVWRLLWTPGPADIATVRLPRALFRLYRIVRIGRLIAKLF